MIRAVPLTVAAPVLGWAGEGVVRTVAGGAVHVDLDGCVISVTGPGVPALPNGVIVGVEPRPFAQPGSPALLAPGILRAGSLVVGWRAEAPPVWDPRLRVLEPGEERAAAARGRAILAALGADVPPLVGRVADVESLLGLGPGLTPEGDDLVAGAAAASAALGRPLALPADLRARTTALSATLLELAVRGAAPAPARVLADPRRDDWHAALAELCSLGSSTGRAWAAGLAWGLLARQARARFSAACSDRA